MFINALCKILLYRWEKLFLIDFEKVLYLCISIWAELL